MASTKEYLANILPMLPNEASTRAMMGEFLLYYRGKVVGGIYDDRILIKNFPAVCKVLIDAPLELPYEGAKPMLRMLSPTPELLDQAMQAAFSAIK